METMLYPKFWIDHTPNVDKVIATPEEIEVYNEKNIEVCKPIVDLENFKESFTKEELTRIIQGVSTPSKAPRYTRDGKQVGEEYWKKLQNNLNIDRLSSINQVKYAITTRRTEMKAFPTFDRLFSFPEDYKTDLLMETAVYPIEPMIILSESADGQWYLAQIYHYLAWIPAKDVAITDKNTLFSYVNRDKFLVVTARRVYTNYNPLNLKISELQLDMGVRIPLAVEGEMKVDFYDQSPIGNFVIKLPTRDNTGNLRFDYGLLPILEDVSIGYLPYTKRNIICQAFKFQGERYGWGGMFNGRDCTAFLVDIYRTMGIKLPRNSLEQGKMAAGVFHEMPEWMPLKERKKLLNQLPCGAALYMDGHAMLYLGKYENEYYMIHDFAGFYRENVEKLTYHTVYEVAVTPLNILTSSGKTYMEALYGAREFVLGK